jgi:5,10-methylenetetrahydromethanopterin reductase
LVEFSVHFLAAGDLYEKVELAKLSERLGFDLIWVADENFYKDVYVTLTMLALGTQKIKIGVGCTNPYSRHPVMTAVAAATLNEVSHGRFALALGSGSSYDLLNHLRIDESHNLRVCKEALKIIRPFLNGEKISYEGKYLKVAGAKLAFQSSSPPIYLACRGPQMLKLAGRLADGVFLNDVPREYLPYAIRQLNEGMREERRNPKDFVVANETPFAVSDDREEARKAVRHVMIYSFLSTPGYVLEKVGLSEKDMKPLVKAFPDFKKVASLVTDEMIDKFSVAGTPKECVKTIRKYMDAGVNHFALALPNDRTDIFEMAAREVMPKIRGR